MHILITGAEQGLGLGIVHELTRKYPGVKIHNLTGAFLRGATKDEIECAVRSLTGGSPFDVVINNFGINHLSWLGDTNEKDAEIIQCNVMVPYWIMNYLASTQSEHLTKVINIASQTYRIAQRTTALYCASKAALVQLTKVVAREMAPNWQVNAFAPGRIVGTEMDRRTQAQVVELRGLQWSNQDAADEYAMSLVPMGRFTNVTEMSYAVQKLLDLPDYITGTVIEATGGA